MAEIKLRYGVFFLKSDSKFSVQITARRRKIFEKHVEPHAENHSADLFLLKLRLMKIRMKHNSVRLRLGQKEVARLDAEGRVEEIIEFGLNPENTLVYALESAPEESEIRASFEKNRITVFVPRAAVEKWARSEQVELETAQKISGGKSLKILIEKDFACRTPRAGEDDSDAFPHPAEGKKC